MVISLKEQQRLETLRMQVSKLEQRVMREAAKRQQRLLALPGKFGYDSLEELITALNATKRTAGGSTANSNRRRRRAIITKEIREEVRKLTNQGRTGAEIAKAVGVSIPSVANIKRALGLSRPRKLQKSG